MTRDLFDTEQFLASLAYDRDLAVELIDAFLEDCPGRVAELTEALAAGDMARGTKLAHSLKGMCGVVRADALGRLALEMEYAGRNGKPEVLRERLDDFNNSLEQARELMVRFRDDGQAGV
ncbi:Hpt domain protein [Pseudodesulfovibrio hydrargyri]|uniref:Hpt domain protein n=1 Tax=Pseudodesulfovibrio hydrargyri TaxID=2125990 RepID=A0A1J5N8H2_9BACT|nr:Hpt domain-containing protein [Pseudodesulfovibrio hydrargyri]OIQ49591.1 Hpt domain protein [Pseudodesulfovibrio hydrargyri]